MSAAAVATKLPPVRRITGLQRQIYSLYKRSLLMVSQKPIETRPAWYSFIMHNFRGPHLGGGLKKKDVVAIEYYLRRGEKMLEAYSREGVKTVSFAQSHDFPLGWIAKGGKEGIERGVRTGDQ